MSLRWAELFLVASAWLVMCCTAASSRQWLSTMTATSCCLSASLSDGDWEQATATHSHCTDHTPWRHRGNDTATHCTLLQSTRNYTIQMLISTSYSYIFTSPKRWSDTTLYVALQSPSKYCHYTNNTTTTNIVLLLLLLLLYTTTLGPRVTVFV